MLLSKHSRNMSFTRSRRITHWHVVGNLSLLNISLYACSTEKICLQDIEEMLRLHGIIIIHIYIATFFEIPQSALLHIYKYTNNHKPTVSKELINQLKTGDCCDKVHIYVCSPTRKFLPRFSSNSEAKASELLESVEEMFISIILSD